MYSKQLESSTYFITSPPRTQSFAARNASRRGHSSGRNSSKGNTLVTPNSNIGNGLEQTKRQGGVAKGLIVGLVEDHTAENLIVTVGDLRPQYQPLNVLPKA